MNKSPKVTCYKNSNQEANCGPKRSRQFGRRAWMDSRNNISNPSGVILDLNLAASDGLDIVIPNVTKNVKRYSQKKRRKRKQFKGPSRKSNEAESLLERRICSLPSIESQTFVDLSCPPDYISENSFTGSATSSAISLSASVENSDGEEKEVPDVNSAGVQPHNLSFSKKMDELEPAILSKLADKNLIKSILNEVSFCTIAQMVDILPSRLITDNNLGNTIICDRCCSSGELTSSDSLMVSNSCCIGTGLEKPMSNSSDESISVETSCNLTNTSAIHEFENGETTGESNCLSQRCSSNVRQSSIPLKRVRHERKASSNSTMVHTLGSSDKHCAKGKHKNHCVWKRVQKSDDVEGICTTENPSHKKNSCQNLEVKVKTKIPLKSRQSEKGKPLRHPSGDKTDQHDELRLSCHNSDMKELQCKLHNGKPLKSAPENSKRKPRKSHKDILNHSKRKDSLNKKTDPSRLPDIVVQQTGESQFTGDGSVDNMEFDGGNLDQGLHSKYLQQTRIHVNKNKARLSMMSSAVSISPCDEVTTKKHSGNEVHMQGSFPSDSLQCSSFDNETVHFPLTACELRNKKEEKPLFIQYEQNAMQHSLNYFLSEEIKELETDSCTIMQAVNNAYKSQVVSEGFNLLIGSPIAEFERLLHSASPTIVQKHKFSSCMSNTDKLIGDPFDQHHLPNLSLLDLWEWYEKPGNYGLQVKVEDHYKKTYHNEFHAYFVPYLSALQLFSRSMYSTYANKKVIGNAKTVCKVVEVAKDPCQMDGPFQSSISSPKPHKEYLPLLELPTLSANTAVHDQCISDQCISDTFSECQDDTVLFEYFESDQPHQRQPFFEKIMGLARGETSEKCKSFGDPSILKALHLSDVHPASWYAVSWYPIYRIPGGDLRAAFLTYHSFGLFLNGHTESKFSDGDIHLISPVVGLQSYNFQGECWFQPRDGVKAEMLGTSGVLKERLKTLEKTASVMAKASVQKGESRSVNRQPDYEFFLSRR